jgi:hypothetical protein
MFQIVVGERRASGSRATDSGAARAEDGIGILTGRSLRRSLCGGPENVDLFFEGGEVLIAGGGDGLRWATEAGFTCVERGVVGCTESRIGSRR